MVLSAFIGIRRQEQQDIKVTPLQLVIIGIMAAAVFVFTVRMVVKLVLS